MTPTWRQRPNRWRIATSVESNPWQRARHGVPLRYDPPAPPARAPSDHLARAAAQSRGLPIQALWIAEPPELGSGRGPLDSSARSLCPPTVVAVPTHEEVSRPR